MNYLVTSCKIPSGLKSKLEIVGLSINHEIPNNYLFVAMSGYDCAFENEECKCSGEVSYGIYDDSKRSHPDVVFGNWSEKKLVERSINCTEENFPDYPEKEYDKPMKNCWCYPSSKRLFLLLKMIMIIHALLINEIQIWCVQNISNFSFKVSSAIFSREK